MVRWGTLELPVTTKAVANAAMLYAKSQAPYKFGGLFQAIDTAPGRGGRDNPGWSVIVRTPKKKNPRGRPYHLMMHGLASPYIGHRIVSGDPHFMFTTAAKFSTLFSNSVEKNMNKNLRVK